MARSLLLTLPGHSSERQKMGFVPTMQEVYEFLQSKDHMHGVLAYLDQDGCPETAFVAFSSTPELSVIFGTSDTSRKYQSVFDVSVVGFNVTDRQARLTVQLQGRVREIDGAELELLEAAHYAKLGESSRRFKSLPDQHFLLIEPFSLRFSDCLEEPWTVTQIISG
jgi:hypothetical protein